MSQMVLVMFLMALLIIILFTLAIAQEKIICEQQKENTTLKRKVEALECALDEEYVFGEDYALERKNNIPTEGSK